MIIIIACFIASFLFNDKRIKLYIILFTYIFIYRINNTYKYNYLQD